MDYLQEMLLEEKGDHEDLTAPLLVIASVDKEEFKQKQMNNYSYEVHMYMSSCKLNMHVSEPKFNGNMEENLY